MSITGDQLRMARALLRMTMKDTAKLSSIDVGTIVRIEAGLNAYAVTLAHLRHVLEVAGAKFIDPLEGEHGPGVALKWGAKLPQRTEGRTSNAGNEDAEVTEAMAWEDASYVQETSASPEIEELRAYWRQKPEDWAALRASSRFALLQEMGLKQL